MSLNLEDIAELAGVSRSTVSRVINGRSDVSEKTRERVLRVIEEHNFRPNHAARSLVTHRTQTIGILVPQPVTAFNSRYFPTLLQGVGDVTHERDYATLLWWGQPGEEEERFSRRILQQNQLVEGLILASHTIDTGLVQRMVQTKIPFVMVERATQFADKISYVTIDNVSAAQDAVEHLIRLGRRRIAHISGLLTNIDGIDRLAGYRNALEKHGIPFDEQLVLEGEFNFRSGYRCMKHLLAYDIDAVFVANDDSAVGVLQALYESGVRVPDDIAVIGFDNSTATFDYAPQLTTVHQPVQQKGAVATALLLDLIEGVVKDPQHVVLPTHLVVRHTCGAHASERSDVSST